MNPSNPPPLPKPAAPAVKRSKGSRVLLGCALVLGGSFALVFVAFAVAAGYFLTTPDQIPTDSIIADASLGVLRLDRDPDDPAAEALVEVAIDAVKSGLEESRRGSGEQPAILEYLERYQREQGLVTLEKLVPREVTVVFERASDGGDEVALAANLPWLPRMYGKVLSFAKDDRQVGEYWGTPYLRMNDGAAIAVVGGTIVYATDESVLRTVLDRIGMRATSGGTGPLAKRLGTFPAGREARAVLRVEDVPDEGAREKLRGCVLLSLDVELVSADEAALAFAVECADAEAASRAREAIASELAKAVPALSRQGLRAAFEGVRAEGVSVAGSGRIAGLEAGVREVVLDSFRGSNGRGSPRAPEATAE